MASVGPDNEEYGELMDEVEIGSNKHLDEMKLSCQLEIRNQLAPANAKKACACTLALCKDKNNLPIILACTNQNIAGQKYEVKKIKKVFSKFLKDGMATLSFSAPPHDLMIRKADPLQLRSFLHFLANAEKENLHFSAPPTRIEKPGPQKMKIAARSDLPNIFPKSLQELTITGVSLLKVPSTLFKLGQLHSLDLSANVLKTLPSEFVHLSKLRALNVTSNQLTDIEAIAKLKSLQVLNVSSNKLSALPEWLCDMPFMFNVDASFNCLTRLPSRIGRMKKLKYLDVTSNQIEVLPSSAVKLDLEHLGISNNPLSRSATLVQPPPTFPPSLKEWAAESVLLHRLPYSPESIPYTLVMDLNQHHAFCSDCLKPVCSSQSPSIVHIHFMEITQGLTMLSGFGPIMAPFEIYKCFLHRQRKMKRVKRK